MKGSHNPSRPSYKGATEEEYSALFKRIEKAFSVEELDKDKLGEWLNSSSNSLLDYLVSAKEVNDRISEAETIEELRELRDDARTLPIHKQEVLQNIGERLEEIKIEEEERKLAESMTELELFAEERGIDLDENTRGGIYSNWGRYHREAIVLFQNGKIKAYKYLD
jgi:hypothetical protein